MARRARRLDVRMGTYAGGGATLVESGEDVTILAHHSGERLLVSRQVLRLAISRIDQDDQGASSVVLLKDAAGAEHRLLLDGDTVRTVVALVDGEELPARRPGGRGRDGGRGADAYNLCEVSGVGPEGTRRGTVDCWDPPRTGDGLTVHVLGPPFAGKAFDLEGTFWFALAAPLVGAAVVGAGPSLRAGPAGRRATTATATRLSSVMPAPRAVSPADVVRTALVRARTAVLGLAATGSLAVALITGATAAWALTSVVVLALLLCSSAVRRGRAPCWRRSPRPSAGSWVTPASWSPVTASASTSCRAARCSVRSPSRTDPAPGCATAGRST